MSDDRLRRGSIVLGYALLFEGGLGFLLRLSTLWNPARRPEPTYLFLVTLAVAPALFGLMTLTSVWSRRFVPGAARAGFAAIVALSVCHFATQFMNWPLSSSIFVFYPLSAVATDIGAPLLWASASVRAEHPADAALHKIGRIGAGLVQLGFVFQFVAHAQYWRSYGDAEQRSTVAGAFFVAASAIDIVESVLLLWASVESVRTATDEDVVRSRALRIRRLLRAWILLSLLTWLLHQVSYSLSDGEPSDLLVDVWRSLLWLTVQLATTFALARGYLLQFGAAVPPTARSGA